jgi:hypothetical protein
VRCLKQLPHRTAPCRPAVRSSASIAGGNGYPSLPRIGRQPLRSASRPPPALAGHARARHARRSAELAARPVGFDLANGHDSRRRQAAGREALRPCQRPAGARATTGTKAARVAPAGRGVVPLPGPSSQPNAAGLRTQSRAQVSLHALHSLDHQATLRPDPTRPAGSARAGSVRRARPPGRTKPAARPGTCGAVRAGPVCCALYVA